MVQAQGSLWSKLLTLQWQTAFLAGLRHPGDRSGFLTWRGAWVCWGHAAVRRARGWGCPGLALPADWVPGAVGSGSTFSVAPGSCCPGGSCPHPLSRPQFPDIVEFSETMANEGKTVIVAALDGTFQRKAFGSILNLVPLAESVVKLTAVCMECFREAAYTKRLGVEKEVEVIGGADKYHSVCRLCYFKKTGLPIGLDSKENRENGLALGVRRLFGPHQLLQCSQAN